MTALDTVLQGDAVLNGNIHLGSAEGSPLERKVSRTGHTQAVHQLDTSKSLLRTA